MQTALGCKQISCVYRDEGCLWVGLRKELAEHLQDDCPHQEVACPNCGTVGARHIMWREPCRQEVDCTRLQDAAAVSIQAAYRGYQGRRLAALRRLQASDGDMEEDALFWDHFRSASEGLGLGQVATPTAVRTFRQCRRPCMADAVSNSMLSVSTVSLDHLSSCVSSEGTTSSEVSNTPERSDSRRVRWGSPRSSAQIIPVSCFSSMDIGAIMSQIEPLPDPLPKDGLSLLRTHNGFLHPADRNTCPA
eukprot:GGOE01026105.1.p1 GENE.GGOE01026105.1~~GGOE01026105.1.p1  ORF type:complete len:248 (+),score=31.40 GGOE01026105.1:69-812(+)